MNIVPSIEWVPQGWIKIDKVKGTTIIFWLFQISAFGENYKLTVVSLTEELFKAIIFELRDDLYGGFKGFMG